MFRQKSYSLAFHIPILNIKVPALSPLTSNKTLVLKQGRMLHAHFPPWLCAAMRGFARYFEIEIKVEVEVEKLHPVFLP